MGAFLSSIVSSVLFGLSWCVCTATASICGAACGNDKPSTVSPSSTSGRKRAAFLFVLSIGLSFAFQYGVAPALGPNSNALTSIPRVGPYLVRAWGSGCNFTQDDSSELVQVCRQNNGVYRVSACTWIFFIFLSIAAKCKPTFNRDAWPAKYTLFLFLVTASAFIPNAPLFSPIYLQLCRIFAALFVIAQQLIYIDIGYNWNESWVTKSNQAEADEAGTGKKWLAAILVSCGILFSATLTGVGLLFGYYGNCTTNNVFISFTLVLSLVATAVQLSGEESSLLASAIISVYATYLCFSAVSANPNQVCNPYYGKSDAWNIAIGIGLTVISLAWTGFSWTASEMHSSDSDAEESRESSPLQREDSKVTGLVTDTNTAHHEEGAASNTTSRNETWKINAILAFLASWYAMILTGWGSIAESGNEANPTASRVSMWIIIGSQWLVFALYIWSMVAPSLFPDRDFS